MSLTTITAKIAGKYPKAILQLRTFKALHRFIRFSRPFKDIPFMWEYVCRSAVAHASDESWALKADKLGVRDFVAARIGSKYLIPLLGHWEDPADIDFDSLPHSFILKTNNGCGTNIFVHDRDTLDRPWAIAKLRKDLVFPYPELSGQRHYSLIKPAVIAEQLMSQGNGASSLNDYKIHCVNGEPVRIYVFTGRDEVAHFDFKVMAFDTDWNEHPEALNEGYKAAPGSIERPACLDEMLDCARKLAQGEEYARIDFYVIDGKIYFGEITLTPDTVCHPAFTTDGMNPILERIKADRRSGRSKATF